VVEAKGLESRGEGMIEVKPEQAETGKVNNVVDRDPEKIMGNRIEIFGIARYKSQPDKEEIEKMKDKKCKDHRACPDHEF
jgi:hypothetical protein